MVIVEGMWYVYKITNLVNGKTLRGGSGLTSESVGTATKLPPADKTQHDFAIFHRALRKYGFDNFKVEQLSKHETEEEALAEEVRMIALLNTRNRDIGYNMTDGGDGASGYKFTDEQRKRLSAAKKGKLLGEENPFYGKHHTEDFKRQQSQVMRNNYQANPEKYDQLNMQQCAIDTQGCVDIQQEWLQGASMEELEQKHSVPITTIHHIIHGTYVAIRGHSILSEDMIVQIIQDKLSTQGLAYKSFTPEQEREIAEKYRTSDLSTGDLAKEYNVSGPTIRKALEANGIVIGPNKRRRTTTPQDEELPQVFSRWNRSKR